MRSEGQLPPPPDAPRHDPAAAPPPPKTARGVKIALGVATVLLGLVALAVWALIHALSD